LPEMDGLFKKDVTPEAGSAFPFGLTLPERQSIVINSPSPPLLSANGQPSLEKQLDELRKWRKVLENAGQPDVPFEAFVLPDTIADWIRQQLGEYWNPTLVFEAARDWLRDEQEPAPFGATPEQALDYWKHYDDIKADLGLAWIDYMQAQADAVLKAVLDNPTPGISITELLRAGHNDLLAAWVGGADNPGALSQIIIAGMAAGNESLNAEIDTDPDARSLLAPYRASLEIDWTLLNTEAIEFAESYAGQLVTGIDATTQEKIRAAITKWLESKGTLDDLAALIAPYLPAEGKMPEQVQNRARLIAQTESIIAYNEGAFKRWERAGINKATWQTVRDKDTCRVCRPMHGQLSTIAEGWRSPYNGKVYRNSAHPGCRCFRRPKVDRVAVDKLVELLAGVAA
jgi:hypothetical protein